MTAVAAGAFRRKLAAILLDRDAALKAWDTRGRSEHVPPEKRAKLDRSRYTNWDQFATASRIADDLPEMFVASSGEPMEIHTHATGPMESEEVEDEPRAWDMGIQVEGYAPTEPDSFQPPAKLYEADVDIAHARDGTNEIHINLIEVQPDARNSPAVRDLLRGLDRLADRTEADAIHFRAAMDMGGYAWAKLGGEATAPGELAGKIRFMLDAVEGDPDSRPGDSATDELLYNNLSSLTAGQVKDVRRVLKEHKNDPKLPQRLAELRSGGKLIGPKVLRGADWQGQFPLKDAAARKRFQHLIYREAA
jgi:hypothetical protein